MNFKVDFDCEQYCKWMDKLGLKSEAINFALLHPEIFDNNSRINARTYTMFANAISGIKDFGTDESLDTILLLAKGCFGDDTNIGNLFVAFVHNKLDKLMSAKEILDGTWETTSKKIKETVMKDGEYRADIASVLTIRLKNYIEFMDKPDADTVTKVINRIDEIINHSETLLTEDLMFSIVKQLNSNPKFKTKCLKLLQSPKIRTKILF